MTMLENIEEEIKSLPEQEFSKFREWFQDYDSQKWDEQVENDLKSGKLDDLAESAISDFRKGEQFYKINCT
ncbi:MAG: hypothetical protein U9N52_06040 [Campylobacterota bacterium]|nr:hypothetical protein [Campylobacterota bacterium]